MAATDLKSALKSKPTDKADPNEAQTGFMVKVAPPDVTVEAPQVTVKAEVPAAQVTVDTAQLVQVMSNFADQMNQAMQGLAQSMAQTQAMVVEVAKVHNEAMQTLTAEMGKPRMSSRPNGFYVELDKDDDGETVGMRIDADNPH